MCPELVLIPPFDSSGADKPGMGAKLLYIRGAVRCQNGHFVLLSFSNSKRVIFFESGEKAPPSG